jgi:outer membrane protein TolC
MGKIALGVTGFLLGALAAGAQTRSLGYYLNNATSKSPLLKDYQNQIKTTTLDSMLIRAVHRPEVLANGQVMIAPVINGYGFDEAITNGGNYQAVLSVSQPIFTKNILAPQYRSLALQNRTVGNQATISILDLKKNITAEYITAYAAYQQIQSNEEVFRLLRAQQEVLKKLVKSGIYKQTDYLSFLVTLQSEEISLNQLQLQYKTDISTLNYLCGIDDTTTVLLAEPHIASPPPNQAARSVFYRKYLIDSLKIINNRDLIDARYKASVNWFADAGLQSSRPATLYKSFGADFGLNLSVPVYDGKQRKLEYRKLKIAEDTRAGYASFFKQQYNQQRAMLLQRLNESRQLNSQIKDKLQSAQLLVNADKELLNTGDLLITDYVLAINGYLSIKNNLIQSEISTLLIINELNYWNQ